MRTKPRGFPRLVAPPRSTTLAQFVRIACLLLAASAPAARATSWLVLPDGTGDFPTIQAAIDAAADGDEILLGDGTFTGPGNQNLLYLGKEVSVGSASGNAAACVLALQAGGGSAVQFEPPDGPSAVLRDVTITGPFVSPILRTAGSPTIDNVIFEDFYQTAVYSPGGSPTIRNSSFTGGRTPTLDCNGGGLTLSDCLFEANTMWNSVGPVELHNVTGASMDRCTFRNNIHTQMSYAPIIVVRRGSATLTDCEIVDNPAPALWGTGETSIDVSLEGCRIENNDGGVWLTGDFGSVATYSVRDCRILGNTGTDGAGIRLAGPVDATIEDTVVEGNRWGLTSPSTGLPGGGFITLRNCRIAGHSQRAVFLRFARMELDGCEVLGNAWHGVELRGPAPATTTTALVRDCLIAGNAASGLRLLDLSEAVVDRCTIASNATITGGQGLEIGGGTTAAIRHSIIWDNCNGNDVRVASDCSASFDCANVDPATITGGGTVVLADILTADPLFCDPISCKSLPSAIGLYTLDPSSPALHQPCGTLGAFGAGCVINTGTASVETSSWARIKARYR